MIDAIGSSRSAHDRRRQGRSAHASRPATPARFTPEAPAFTGSASMPPAISGVRRRQARRRRAGANWSKGRTFFEEGCDEVVGEVELEAGRTYRGHLELTPKTPDNLDLRRLRRRHRPAARRRRDRRGGRGGPRGRPGAGLRRAQRRMGHRGQRPARHRPARPAERTGRRRRPRQPANRRRAADRRAGRNALARRGRRRFSRPGIPARRPATPSPTCSSARPSPAAACRRAFPRAGPTTRPIRRTARSIPASTARCATRRASSSATATTTAPASPRCSRSASASATPALNLPGFRSRTAWPRTTSSASMLGIRNTGARAGSSGGPDLCPRRRGVGAAPAQGTQGLRQAGARRQ